MYALLFPSAHNFISAVDVNVNVDVRAMGVPTPTPTPCLLPSPAWTAFVCEPRTRAEFVLLDDFFFLDDVVVFMAVPFWARISSQQAPIWADAQRTGARLIVARC
jgi:hypothetical protein